MSKPRVTLKPTPVRTNLVALRISEPYPRLVKALEALLERAKTGELQGFVGCFVFENSTVDDAWIETPKAYQASITNDRIVGSLHRLMHKLLTLRTRDETDRFIYFDEDDPA